MPDVLTNTPSLQLVKIFVRERLIQDLFVCCVLSRLINVVCEKIDSKFETTHSPMFEFFISHGQFPTKLPRNFFFNLLEQLQQL